MATSVAFETLAEDVKQQIREKQKQAQAKKKAAKRSSASATDDAVSEPARAVERRTMLTQDEYFDACPFGLFRQRGFMASEANVDVLMGLDFNQVVGQDGEGKAIHMSDFNYFMFDGSDKEIWDPTFLARLAHEGFFTITHRGPRGTEPVPLPELQPFYGVLDWPDLNKSKSVRKALQRVSGQKDSQQYYLYCSRNMDLAYNLLDQYQKEQHGVNWMTRKYMDAFKRASDDPRINFRLHSIELYDGPLPDDDSARSASSPSMIAGEIGYSIGRVYTSLSGFSKRDAAGVGWIQLACLGKWLEHKQYAFWSLGHCYSPQMDYKRQLGHRIYTRADFLERLKTVRGPFREQDGASSIDATLPFKPLEDGEACDLNEVLSAKKETT